MSNYKLTTPLKYEHTLLAVPVQEAVFPLHLCFGENITPFKEGDSGRIEQSFQGSACPVILKQYTEREHPYMPVLHWGNVGWKLFTIRQNDALGVIDSWPLAQLSYLGQTVIPGEKINFPLRYAHFAEARQVRGFRFPMDMNRYDRCYPFSVEDVKEIEKSLMDIRYKTNPIRLVKHTDGRKPMWTPARWDSFGWQLVEIDRPVEKEI